MAKSEKLTRKAKVSVNIELEDVRDGDATPDLALYAFTSGGTLLDRVELKGDSASLAMPTGEERRAVRIVVGPRDLRDESDIAELFRLNAAERTIPLEVGATKADFRFTIPRPDWRCWLLGLCTVQGKLLKRVESGGVPIDMSVCDAEVEVYEVDPLPRIVYRIPEDILERLREVVRRPPPWPPKPWPPKDGPVPHGPGPDPGPELARVRQLIELTHGTNQPKSPGPADGTFVSRAELSQLAEQRFTKLQPAAEDEQTAEETVRTLNLAPVPPAVPSLDGAARAIQSLAASEPIALAAHQGSSAFRNALIANPDLVRPLLCRFFPVVTRQLVATATTDECGHFRTWFFHGCDNDTPDLYFVAYHRWGPFRIPIYNPLPVTCHTHWDYQCGSEVTLRTTSPFAPTCPPCRPIVAEPGWVIVMAIGNTPLSRIHGTGAELASSPSQIGLTAAGEPFGGLLRPRIEFDNALREDLGVRYYRVSWKKAGSGDPWVPLELAVHRHYTHKVGSKLVLEAYSLGPQVVGTQAGLFEIPPPLPPIGQWSLPDVVEDTASAKFPTGGCQPATYGLVPPGSEGIYKLRVELFDDAGAPVNLAERGVHFVVPKSTDLNGTVETEEAAALGLVPGAPVDSGNAFVMRLHIDNNPTSAEIEPPLLNGSAEPGEHCGTLEYSPSNPGSLTIPYTAMHPNGFANYGFVLKRGVTALTPPSAGGPVGSGSFSSSELVETLLDGCEVAGFAEELSVEGTATDGWSRQRYDSGDLRAFVLQPSRPD
jgi:hypothetical protein